MTEWPLLIFTICLQTAIGAILWAVVIRTAQKEAPSFKLNSLAALILAAVAMLASLLHLGKPMLALTSIANLATSWLSREIFFSGGFFCLLIIYWWLERSGKAPSAVNACGYVTAAVGLIAVFSMARIYVASIMPAWQHANTFIGFYATTIVLGGILFYLTAGEWREKLPRIELILCAVVLIQVLGYMAGTGVFEAAGGQGVLILSWVLTLGGVFLLLLSRLDKLAKQTSFLYVALVAIVVGQIASRYLFYMVGTPIGFGL